MMPRPSYASVAPESKIDVFVRVHKCAGCVMGPSGGVCTCWHVALTGVVNLQSEKALPSVRPTNAL